MSDCLVRHFGWRALLVQGDPVVLERWKWLRDRFRVQLGLGASEVLDAGCGNGCFALWAATLAGDVLGLSDSPGDLHKARQRAGVLGLRNVTFAEYDLRTIAADGDLLGRFDVILCLEVVEHVIDDVGLLRNLAACLRPGGTLLLTTPTQDHKALFGEEAHQTAIEDGRHVRWGYTERELDNVLTLAGLEPLEFARFGGYLTQRVCGALWRLSKISLPLAWTLTFPLRAVTFVDRRVTMWRQGAFLSVGVVAHKPLLPTSGYSEFPGLVAPSECGTPRGGGFRLSV